MPLVLRHARPGEAATLEALQRRSSLIWDEDRDNLLAHPDAIEVPVEALRERRVRVAARSGRIVGFSLVAYVRDGVHEVDGLFVEPPFMRQGVGRLLLDDMVATARDQGVRRLEVTANPQAVGFYEKAGFVSGGIVETRFRPAPRMHLDLAH